MSTNVYKAYQPPSEGGGLYHKFEDGVTYIMRIASEPVVYQTLYEASNGETNISTKYAWVVWNVEEKTAQVMQLPVTAYRQVAAFGADDDYGDPQRYNLKVTRRGKGLETKYEVIASPKQSSLSEVDENAPAEVAKIDLKEVISKGKGVSHVMYLFEAIESEDKGKMDLKKVQDTVYDGEDDDQKPVDLSEIPF